MPDDSIAITWVGCGKLFTALFTKEEYGAVEGVNTKALAGDIKP